MSYLPDNYNAIVSSKLADTMKAMQESMYPYLQTSCNAIVYSKLADTIKVMQESMHPHLQNLQASCNTALLSTLADTMKIVEESAPSIANFMQSFEAIRRSFDETIARITPQIHTVLRGVSIAIKISHVNQKLGDAQYVYWDFMQEDFINSILENSNTNEVLEEYLDKDDYKTVNTSFQVFETKRVNRQSKCGRMNDVKQSNTTGRDGSHDIIIHERQRDWQAEEVVFRDFFGGNQAYGATSL